MAKLLTTLLLVLFSLTATAKDAKPDFWGKLIKTEKETQGHNYFLYLKKGKKEYVYPVGKDSNINKNQLNKLAGKYIGVYGATRFERSGLEGTNYIMVFDIDRAKSLALKDLHKNKSIKEEQLNPTVLWSKRVQKSDKVQISGLNDTAVNTAIFVGGAALAAEVLKNAIKKN